MLSKKWQLCILMWFCGMVSMILIIGGLVHSLGYRIITTEVKPAFIIVPAGVNVGNWTIEVENVK